MTICPTTYTIDTATFHQWCDREEAKSDARRAPKPTPAPTPAPAQEMTTAPAPKTTPKPTPAPKPKTTHVFVVGRYYEDEHDDVFKVVKRTKCFVTFEAVYHSGYTGKRFTKRTKFHVGGYIGSLAYLGGGTYEVSHSPKCEACHVVDEQEAIDRANERYAEANQRRQADRAANIAPNKRGQLLATLGIKTLTATMRDIKLAYRASAMQHHPDKGGDPAKFRAAQEAYEALTGN